MSENLEEIQEENTENETKERVKNFIIWTAIIVGTPTIAIWQADITVFLFPYLLTFLIIAIPAYLLRKGNGIYVYLVGLVVFALFFHILPSQLTIFPKGHPTFSRTIVTNEVVQEMIKEYNNGNVIERMQMENDPLYQELKRKGIIYTVDK